MNFVLLSSIILALNILFIQFSRYKAESLLKFGFQYLNSCLNTESRLPNSRFVLRIVNFIETRRATQRCSFCVPTMLNPLGSKFEQDAQRFAQILGVVKFY